MKELDRMSKWNGYFRTSFNLGADLNPTFLKSLPLSTAVAMRYSTLTRPGIHATPHYSVSLWATLGTIHAWTHRRNEEHTVPPSPINSFSEYFPVLFPKNLRKSRLTSGQI